MTATPDDWLPRTPHEAIIKAATLLAVTVPLVPVARARIVDVLPGHSGRPVGTGDVAAGRGAPTVTPGDDDAGPLTVVERNALAATDPAWRDLEQLDRLIDTITAAAGALIARPALLTGAPRDRLLARASQVLQRLAELPPARYDRRAARTLYNATHDLHQLATTWAGTREGAPRSPTLAIDNSGTLCRSCLRAGHRKPRSPRFPREGLCETCGRFQGEQGFLPTLEILDAIASGVHGSTIAKMIREAKRARPKPARKRRR